MRLSVVVPCHDEEAVLDRLADELDRVLTPLVEELEVVLVDDGSRDRTLEVLRALSERDPRFQYLSLSRNFGKEAALLAGLTQASGDAVAIMDADLQHPPTVLASMLPLLDQGFDQVVARRTRTGDEAVRTLASRTYYRLMNRLVEVRLEDGIGDFRVLSRTALAALLSLGESNRFSKGLFAWIGFRTAVVDYENVPRAAGTTKWGMRQLLNYGIDSILSFNTRPLRMAIHFGTLVSVLAFGYALWTIISGFVRENPTPGYVTTISAVIGMGGVQMILLGVIGEYLGRIYAETKARPHFLVRESSTRLAAPVVIPLGTQAAVLPRAVASQRTPGAHP
jgi:glycosyltransferase involved in cell wall biosynthesis